MSDDKDKSAPVFPIRAPIDATLEANVAMLVVAVHNCTEAVGKNSTDIKKLNTDINNLSSEIIQSQASWAQTFNDIRQENALYEREVSSLLRKVENLETRQEQDEKLRSQSVETELAAVKALLKEEQEKKATSEAKEKEYLRTRRNYWIGIGVSVILGILSTVIATQVESCHVRAWAPPKENAAPASIGAGVVDVVPADASDAMAEEAAMDIDDSSGIPDLPETFVD